MESADPAPVPALHGLPGVLLESRQRWQDFTGLAADLAFETDAAGRLSFLWPDRVVGWEGAALLGEPARRLLLYPEPNPFQLREQARGLHAWLGASAEQAACFSFSVVPLADAAGRFAGMRGIGRNVTAELRELETQAAALRRARALETLVRRVRRQVLAPRMLTSTLEALGPALGCTSAAVLEIGPGAPARVMHRHGADPMPLVDAIGPLLDQAVPMFIEGPSGEPLAFLPHPQRVTPRHALVTWRPGGARPFDEDDRHLLEAAADLLFVALGNQVLQQELELQARTDVLTGLLNRRAFLEDMHRRLDRLSGERYPMPRGALLFIDLDNFKPLNDRLGHEAGDSALASVGRLLRDIVRPTDLVARLGGDEFAAWLEGADTAAATMRAEAIRRTALTVLPGLLPGLTLPLTFSIGIAMRAADGSDTPDSLISRADSAMYAAKRHGRNGWRLETGPTGS
ncbi:sensor domain-containing diguanylate cyclase [Belnapia rosea]|uniref:diguanylate cyclase n=1 Tax=Belnapia rosea TaxID=938405 RepID=A0A1G6X4B9_9PROT|nr:GGDEF domain-containing protein [Belnapia rosea]SDB67901.1 diguanylate cyclase (GGDEF) domain-containing protein [Belnapia rosea]SDD72958.1 diguanylate cyclase (GGDEF) domain-containing protein [Belnapia rosea]